MTQLGGISGTDRSVEVITPEGVPIRFRVASPFARLGAVALDLLILGGIFALLFLLVAVSLSTGLGMAGLWMGIVVGFLVRCFYFSWFEIRTGGQTPGKRVAKIRVVDRRGGPLRTESLLARNFLREVEHFGAVGLLVSVDWTGAKWLAFGSTALPILLILLPFTQRRRQRLGDLLAGTMVVETPREFLLPDIAERRIALDADGASDWRFLPAHLSHYGVYELQVLENILRTPPNKSTQAANMKVGQNIRRRIGWTDPVGPTEERRFLQAFYGAQRKHLEERALMGQRKERKSTRPSDSAPEK